MSKRLYSHIIELSRSFQRTEEGFGLKDLSIECLHHRNEDHLSLDFGRRIFGAAPQVAQATSRRETARTRTSCSALL
jgi:hypothetical protein